MPPNHSFLIQICFYPVKTGSDGQNRNRRNENVSDMMDHGLATKTNLAVVLGESGVKY